MAVLKSKKKIIAVAISCVLTVTAVVLAGVYRTDIIDFLYKDYESALPQLATYSETDDKKMINGDIYVSTHGSDENSGTKDSPFLTIEKAVEEVRKIEKTDKNGITVCIEGGEYVVSSLEFTKEDSGTKDCPITYCSYNGEVVVNGGKNLDSEMFSAVTDENVLARLSDEAKKNVLCTDLTKLGLSIDDWGKLYPVGLYGTQANYDGDTTGPVPCNLYFNGNPLITARYPNEGFLKTVEIIREGQGQESSTSNHAKTEGWENLRNPETTIFTVDNETAERINSYASLDDVWLWTALIYEWADTTVPLKSFDYVNKTLEPAYVSKYGAVSGSSYYIFNVIEELDSPGEWCLDRDCGMLYIYPPDNMDNAEITISLSAKDLITVKGAEYLCFDSLSVKGTRDNGIVINSNNVTVKNCNISELSGSGVKIDGFYNTVSDCEFAHIGATAVEIRGGDRDTLKAGENRVENCFIHDFSEVSITAGQGVNIGGVGNVCAHNEFFNSPQQAIWYSGNNNVIEYNYIRDAVLLSDDSSAIYTGRRWDEAGSVVRYNVICNIGSDEFSPHGIYLDDGASGQTVYGNIIINCKGNAFLIGGGRNNEIYNNIIINCSTAFFYDSRSRDAVLDPDFWFEHSREGFDMHTNLLASPWQSKEWLTAYPYMTGWSLDYDDTENPDFVANPSDSKVCGNMIVYYKDDIGEIEESVYRFSDISDNAFFRFGDMKNLFADADNGNYKIKDIDEIRKTISGFGDIPVEKIGRLN